MEQPKIGMRSTQIYQTQSQQCTLTCTSVPRVWNSISRYGFDSMGIFKFSLLRGSHDKVSDPIFFAGGSTFKFASGSTTWMGFFSSDELSSDCLAIGSAIFVSVFNGFGSFISSSAKEDERVHGSCKIKAFHKLSIQGSTTISSPTASSASLKL